MTDSEDAKERRRRRDKLARDNLSDSYVRKLLIAGSRMRAESLPDALVEFKREHLRFNRFLRALEKGEKKP